MNILQANAVCRRARRAGMTAQVSCRVPIRFPDGRWSTFQSYDAAVRAIERWVAKMMTPQADRCQRASERTS